jgi:transposase
MEDTAMAKAFQGISALQRQILEHVVRCTTSVHRLVERAQIVLLAFGEGKAKKQIAREQSKSILSVRKWCSRWEEAHSDLLKIEENLAEAEDYTKAQRKYTQRVLSILDDALRCGAPPVFTAEQVVGIVAIACEVLDESDEGISHWTHRQISQEAVRRGIVEKISPSTVGRLLRQASLKPHRSRYWLNSPMKDTEQFQGEAKVICDLYQDAPKLHEQGKHMISIDEKTGIQALERLYPTHAASEGKVELQEFEYERHGTLCLTANFEVATGKVLAPTIAPTRTEADFVNHLQKTVASDPEGEWIFIADNLNTHVSESLVRWVAQQCTIEEDLGRKGKEGILLNMKTRKEFLSDPDHRIRFVYTPKHASWLNQVEIWFSVLVRRLLRRGSFTSLDHLRDRILKFIDLFNKTMAKPYKWTYTGQPLAA